LPPFALAVGKLKSGLNTQSSDEEKSNYFKKVESNDFKDVPSLYNFHHIGSNTTS
jgi:hypothetical protein